MRGETALVARTRFLKLRVGHVVQTSAAKPRLGSAEESAQRTGQAPGFAADTSSGSDAFAARAQRHSRARFAMIAVGSSRVETFARVLRAPMQKSEFHVCGQIHAPTPNQAMQRTASKPAFYLLRVCHPPNSCVGSHSGLAVADLVSR